ncbi:unnamed protein product [Rhizophagus irregularis]|uniref:Uncharacterized protein n=1 Tax=Rhizophagus irregularis TaxID=588596 RepID=A0A915YUE5_9GLOM|nr:unnamed protein product [Rhizophagus irregularis]CAB5342048.1 unnamed protein product [Rhizophagus irregularis]
MCNDIKWKLPSGSYVEGNYFNYTKDLPCECPSHSFILDIENGSIMKLFNKEDQEYIKTYNAMADPELEDGLMEYLVTFNETDISKMRDKINAEIDMTPYDPKKHFDYQYVYQFNSNIWNIIIDSCLIYLYTVEFIRGEGCSLASSERKIKQEKVQKQGLKLAGSWNEILIRYAIAQYLQQDIMDLSAVLVAKLRIKQNIELSNKKCNNLKEALRNKQSKRSRSDNDLPDNQTSPRKKSSYIILAFN